MTTDYAALMVEAERELRGCRVAMAAVGRFAGSGMVEAMETE